MPGPDHAALEALLQYKFLNRELLEKALRDPSFANEPEGAGYPDNSTLAYLGTAVLDLTVRYDLMKPAPADARPVPKSAVKKVTTGSLSEAADKLVNTAILAAAARRLALGPYLQLGKGSEATRDNDRVLARAFEAVFGAIMLDSDHGQAAKTARRFISTAVPRAASAPAK